MGKISDVIYEEVDPAICSVSEAGGFYYYLNLIGIHDMFQDDYERYEHDQLRIRNTILGEYVEKDNAPRHPKVNTTIFGISSLKNKSVIVTEY